LNALNFRPAAIDDFEYIYGLCEATMRAYVELDFGDRFEQIARPTIQQLLERQLFSKIYVNDLLVGAVACERHGTHIQLEELYIEAASQKQGVGTRVMARVLEQSSSLCLPVRLHVLASNSAQLFYEKLGFLVTRSTKEMNFMEYKHSSIGASVA
jgi:ribosomal protein S18 acetylase RimI-like enzyme